MKTILLYIMVALYLFAGITHFWHPEFYKSIMPSYLPVHSHLVYISGFIEIVLALLLIPSATRSFAAWCIIIMLGVYLLVHVQMVIDFLQQPEKPLWIAILRVPLQFVLMFWAAMYTRKPSDVATDVA